jgi:glyoxylase-like metal-dependent hydrolase (beta-lactamase superfamily II)
MDPLLIPARNPSAWTGATGNNTFLLRGAVPTLVDAGVGDGGHLEDILTALDGAPLAQVLLTHGHPDHAGGVPMLRALWPAMRVVAGALVPDVIQAGDGHLRAIHTPGHSKDHRCFFDESSGDLYCGDLARADGTIVIPASRGGSLREYLASLRRVRDLAPRRLLPGHGPIVTDPAALIDRYLAHRADRERQIVAVLGGRALTPQQIVPEVYGTLAAGLDAAAAESVLAHLIKLEEEGRAENDGDIWRLK